MEQDKSLTSLQTPTPDRFRVQVLHILIGIQLVSTCSQKFSVESDEHAKYGWQVSKGMYPISFINWNAPVADPI